MRHSLFSETTLSVPSPNRTSYSLSLSSTQIRDSLVLHSRHKRDRKQLALSCVALCKPTNIMNTIVCFVSLFRAFLLQICSLRS